MIKIRDNYRAPGLVKVTWWLLGINFISFLSANFGGASAGHSLFDVLFMGSVMPAEFGSGEAISGLSPSLMDERLPALITVFTYQILHSGWFHLFSNMIVLAVFGPNVEAYMGPKRFLMFCLTCGAAGALFHIAANLETGGILVGASGMTSGLFGAYFALFPGNDIRITLGFMRSNNYRDALIPVKVIVVFWIASQILDSILPSAVEGRQKISYLSHAGGFLAGYLLANGKNPLQGTRRNFKVFMGGKSGA